jgi:hypothetical protein
MATRLISAAIASGAPAYNSGQLSLCVSIYAETASRLLNECQTELAPGVATALTATLKESNAVSLGGQQGKGSEADRLAWSFRRAFDSQMNASNNRSTNSIRSNAIAGSARNSNTTDVISNAIARGAPAYNGGAIRECVQIYADTAQQLLQRNDLSESNRRLLEDALSQSQGMFTSSENGAWTLRKAFDAILRPSSASESKVYTNRISKNSSGTDALIRNFAMDAGLALQTSCVNDTVMGGRSSSSVRFTNEGALFEGMVTKQGGGGFVSLRFKADNKDALTEVLCSGTGIAVSLCCLQGCSSWKIQLNESSWFPNNGTQWQAGFSAPKGSEQIVRLPFKEFFPTWRGQLQGNQGISSGELQSIESVGFMMSFLDDDGSPSASFQEGRFQLLIKWIAVY